MKKQRRRWKVMEAMRQKRAKGRRKGRKRRPERRRAKAKTNDNNNNIDFCLIPLGRMWNDFI